MGGYFKIYVKFYGCIINGFISSKNDCGHSSSTFNVNGLDKSKLKIPIIDLPFTTYLSECKFIVKSYLDTVFTNFLTNSMVDKDIYAEYIKKPPFFICVKIS